MLFFIVFEVVKSGRANSSLQNQQGLGGRRVLVLPVEVDFSGFPFFTGLREEFGDQAEERGFVGENACDAVTAFESWLMRSSALEVRRQA
jgi:hypothetical protein